MATHAVTGELIIRRPRLIRLLDESPARIKLLVAPAGYGKTTLAEQWLEVSGRPTAWYRGGHASADVAALAAGLSGAAGDLVAGAGERMRERMRAFGNPEEDVDLLAELLAEDLASWPSDAWLTFDDYHLAMESKASERFVEVLTQQTQVQFLLTSRRRPTWATARRFLYGELQELGTEELAMNDAEAAAVLGSGNAKVPGLVEKARGWAAVIGLAAATDPATIPSDDSLPESLYEYLAEELFQTLSSPTQRVLPGLALVTQFSRKLVSSFVDETTTSMVLEEAERIGVVSTEGGILQLHPLFRQFHE